ncbi:hypothetical protein [Aporhodopirellula aestuarii]|uniref:Uncharacterized protein n=1 Tax=Aporhodopirellula aestuarii TaxID=2950107 RepID=A0ABT0U526_9BACT|nr:hypothetical protein [Aporhodopirellula aestuarii]MCM2371897.1 hypothetical protein [Aporhodopirellula aestuarii]
MAGCLAKVTPAACNACQNESNPRAINVVMIGMALVNKKRRKQDVTELEALLRNYIPDEDPMPATLKISSFWPGPGNELKKMIAWFAKPSETCNCETRVDTMNDWGAEGCRRNIDTIVDWLLEEAQARGLPHGRFTQENVPIDCRSNFISRIGIRFTLPIESRLKYGGSSHANAT